MGSISLVLGLALIVICQANVIVVTPNTNSLVTPNTNSLVTPNSNSVNTPNTNSDDSSIGLDKSDISRNDILRQHNKYRRKHHVSPLKLDRKLSAKAQKWAEYLLSLGHLEHSHSHDIGENLAS